MENKSHALAAGTFVLLALSLLIALAVWLTRDNRQMRLFELTSAEAVNGLQPQASVRFKGVPVGKVTAIGLDPVVSGQVLIRIAINEQAPITQSTFATLGFQGVTGLAFVQLDDSGESNVSLESSPRVPARIPMRPGLLSKISDRSVSILSQLEETTRRVNLLLAPANQQSLLSAVNSLDQAAASIKNLSAQTGKVLPQLVQDSSATLKVMKDTSQRVGDSADEARRSARAFRTVTERMSAPDGTLDQIAAGSDTLAAAGQNLNSATLPRVNRTLDDSARSVRQLGRAAGTFSDNPQSLLFGNGTLVPGPGEPGFVANPGKP
jgi:phospholipid/cholesterol/gamma-HCH transport system substrate-binding protein